MKWGIERDEFEVSNSTTTINNNTIDQTANTLLPLLTAASDHTYTSNVEKRETKTPCDKQWEG